MPTNLLMSGQGVATTACRGLLIRIGFFGALALCCVACGGSGPAASGVFRPPEPADSTAPAAVPLVRAEPRPSLEWKDGAVLVDLRQEDTEVFLGPNWSSPSVIGRWSLNDAATLALPLKPEADVTAYIQVTRAYPDTQTVQVLFNGWEAAKIEATHGSRHEIALPIARWAPNGIQRLRFVTPEAVSPLALGKSSDNRTLGFMPKTILLKQTPRP